MPWEFRSDLPIYLQLTQQITQRIVSGFYPIGSKLPPVREFAIDAGVNPNTMQRALCELEQQQLLFTQRTAGRFVTVDNTKIEAARLQLARKLTADFLSGMTQLGFSKTAAEQALREYISQEETQ